MASLAPLFCGCVGPTTPFGAIDSFIPVKKTATLEDQVNRNVSIKFKPKKQVLHDRSDFVVEIKDREQTPALDNVQLFFNQIDVTDRFLTHVSTEKLLREKMLRLSLKDVRLKITDPNQIQIVYQSKKGPVRASLRPPSCDYFDQQGVYTIKGFQPPDEYLRWVHEIARQSKINPNLLTGIVAQESGFNPKAVSWAKALGLTQITPLAEAQIEIDKRNWPQSREISSLNYIQLKSKVARGLINESNDWRLNPQRSLQGGADYVKYLHEYWSTPENVVLLKKLKGSLNINLSKVILASYNSGPARVKSRISLAGDRWLNDNDLQEAHKYVNKVFSYCYHFSQGSVRDDG